MPDALPHLFPPIQPRNSGMLAVDDIHTIYWEEVGNPKGIPVVFFHGGPGAGMSPQHRRFFNPDHYRVILFDQRLEHMPREGDVRDQAGVMRVKAGRPGLHANPQRRAFLRLDDEGGEGRHGGEQQAFHAASFPDIRGQRSYGADPARGIQPPDERAKIGVARFDFPNTPRHNPLADLAAPATRPLAAFQPSTPSTTNKTTSLERIQACLAPQSRQEIS